MLEDCLRGKSVVDGIQGLQACIWEITLCLITRYFLRVSDFEMKKGITISLWYESYLNKRTVWERMQM